MREEPQDFEGTLTGESSSKAFEFRGDYWDEAEWLPRSQAEITSHDPDDETRCVVRISGWLVSKNPHWRKE